MRHGLTRKLLKATRSWKCAYCGVVRAGGHRCEGCGAGKPEPPPRPKMRIECDDKGNWYYTTTTGPR